MQTDDAVTTRRRTEGYPDPGFIGIGMPSSGTRWLYDQLAWHRDVWLPVQKELHFFDRGMRHESARKRLHETLLLPPESIHGPRLSWRKRLAGLNRALFRRSQVRFLLEYLTGPGAQRRARIEMATQPRRDAQGSVGLLGNPGLEAADYEHYRRLFACADRPVTGEITPAYASLEPDYVGEICEEFRGTRFILVVRDPVDRAVSSYRKLARKGLVDKMAIQQGAAASGVDEEKLAAVDPCAVADRWLQAAGKDRLLTVRFRDLVERPGWTRDAVAEFLGVPGGWRAFRRRPGFNRKQRKSTPEAFSRAEIETLRARMDERLAEVTRRYRRRFEA